MGSADGRAAPGVDINSVVRDRVTGRTGRVISVEADGRLLLCPLRGGPGWEVSPTDVVRLDSAEALRARVAEANAASTWGRLPTSSPNPEVPRRRSASPATPLPLSLTRPVPVAGCADCTRLAEAEAAAGRDQSAAADERIRLRRHLAAAHR